MHYRSSTRSGASSSLSMIRQTDNSHIHGHKVVKLPKCALAWVEFTTPTKLVKQIDMFRKQISKDERENHVKAMKKWKLANTNKPANQRCQQSTAPLDIDLEKALSMRLRVLADLEVGQSFDPTRRPRECEVDLCHDKACTAIIHGSNPHPSWLSPSHSSSFAAQS